MEDDEKTTARAKSGEPVRTTAPAGTPVRKSPSDRPPSDRPVDTLTPPRTVGGRTARLRSPSEDEAPKARSRGREPEASHDYEPPPSGPLQSAGRTVGGNTMKLATVDQIPAHEASVVGGAALHNGPRAPQNGRASPAHAPAAPAAAPAPSPPTAPPLAPSPPTRAPTAPAPAAPPVTSDAEDDPSVFASPLAVTVGIVSLCMGSILTLTVGRRWVLPDPSTGAGDLRAAVAPQEPPATAATVAARPAATQTAATAATVASAAAVATEAPPTPTPAITKPTQAPGALPQRAPTGAPRPTGKRPIFDLPGK